MVYPNDGTDEHSRVPLLVRLFFLVALTAFFGELKMNPLGDTFRFSLGTACFYFGLIWFQELSPVLTGIATGIGIVCFRMLIDFSFSGIPYIDSWKVHFPSAVFYLVFALVIQIFHVRKKLDHPLWLGTAGLIAEVTGNLAELSLRNEFQEGTRLDLRSITILVFFGVLRSFFVVGIYNMLKVRQADLTKEQQQKRIDSLLLVNSGLFEESVFLNKSMSNIEEVTRQSYELYRGLKDHGATLEISTEALRLAQQIHELKKDSQRILAGLSKIMKTDELHLRLKLSQLLELVVRTNQNYADMLKKQIHFQIQCNVDLETDQLYMFLSIFNNLVTNAVEAIDLEGEIGIDVTLQGGGVVFYVWNTGPVIPLEEQDWIFQIGYTTKFDRSGNPSTGLGLAHVQELISLLSGTIEIEEASNQKNSQRTTFHIQIPTKNLLQGG